MSSPANKDQFLQQFEQIVNGVLNNKGKVRFLHKIYRSNQIKILINYEIKKYLNFQLCSVSVNIIISLESGSHCEVARLLTFISRVFQTLLVLVSFYFYCYYFQFKFYLCFYLYFCFFV